MKSFLSIILYIGLALAKPEGSLDDSRSSLNTPEYLPSYHNGQNNFPIDKTSNGLFHKQKESLINKQIYLFSAPHEEASNPKHFILGQPQKNYRVVFVKTPVTGPIQLTAEYAPQEEKTLIYVLAQKENEIDPIDIVTPAPTEPSKPEVFFIKYKTPKEAANAQQQIQAQYDALGGTSEFSDEGILPVASVERLQTGGFPTESNSKNNYLPPNF